MSRFRSARLVSAVVGCAAALGAGSGRSSAYAALAELRLDRLTSTAAIGVAESVGGRNPNPVRGERRAGRPLRRAVIDLRSQAELVRSGQVVPLSPEARLALARVEAEALATEEAQALDSASEGGEIAMGELSAPIPARAPSSPRTEPELIEITHAAPAAEPLPSPAPQADPRVVRAPVIAIDAGSTRAVATEPAVAVEPEPVVAVAASTADEPVPAAIEPSSVPVEVPAAPPPPSPTLATEPLAEPVEEPVEVAETLLAPEPFPPPIRPELPAMPRGFHPGTPAETAEGVDTSPGAGVMVVRVDGPVELAQVRSLTGTTTMTGDMGEMGWRSLQAGDVLDGDVEVRTGSGVSVRFAIGGGWSVTVDRLSRIELRCNPGAAGTAANAAVIRLPRGRIELALQPLDEVGSLAAVPAIEVLTPDRRVLARNAMTIEVDGFIGTHTDLSGR